MTGSSAPVISGRGAAHDRHGQLVPAAGQRRGDGPADHPVGRAVIEPVALGQLLREVGRRGEMADRLLGQDVGVHGQAGHHRGSQPDQPPARSRAPATSP